MATKEELRRQWRVYGNGLVHAAYSAVGSALASALVFIPLKALDWITIDTLWTASGAAVASGIVNGVVGYIRKSPLPDIWVVSDTTTTETHVAADGMLTTTQIRKITTKELDENKEHQP